MFGDLQKNWGWLLALGIRFLILGVIGLVIAIELIVNGWSYIFVALAAKSARAQ